MHYQFHCNFYHYSLINYVYDHLTHLFLILYSIQTYCLPAIPLLGWIVLLPYCDLFCLRVYCLQMRINCVVTVFIAVSFVVIYFLIMIGWPLWYWLFLCVFEFPPTFLAPPMSVFCAAATTLRLHIFACMTLICSSFCLNVFVQFPLVVIRSVNAESIAAVSDEKFMKASSISLRLIFLRSFILPLPQFFWIPPRSRYASWKCALKCTHMRYSSEILFHMW